MQNICLFIDVCNVYIIVKSRETLVATKSGEPSNKIFFKDMYNVSLDGPSTRKVKSRLSISYFHYIYSFFLLLVSPQQSNLSNMVIHEKI